MADWTDSLSSFLTNPVVATALPTVLGGVGGALSSPIMEGRRGAIGGAIRGAGQGLGQGIQAMQQAPLLHQQLAKEKVITQQAQMTLDNEKAKQNFAQSLPPDQQALFMSDPKGYMDTYVVAPHKAKTDMAALQEQAKNDPNLAALLPSVSQRDPAGQIAFAEEYFKGQVPNKETEENRKQRESDYQQTQARLDQQHQDTMAGQAEARGFHEQEEKENLEFKKSQAAQAAELKKMQVANQTKQQVATNIERSKPGIGFAATDADGNDNVTYTSPGLTSFTTKTMKVKVPGSWQHFHPHEVPPGGEPAVDSETGEIVGYYPPGSSKDAPHVDFND